MLLQAALLLSLLAGRPGGSGGGRAAAQAPLPPAKPAQSGLWEHRSQLTGDKDSREHGHSKPGRDTT